LPRDRLILIGYPLKEAFDEKRLGAILEETMKRFKPKSVSLTAPAIPFSLNDSLHPPSDHYYRLDLSDLSIRQKVRNMLTRTGRELSVGRRRDWGEEHKKMVYDFLKAHPVEEPTRLIFERIGEYLSASPTAWLFDARNKSGDLVAFDVGEFNPKDYFFLCSISAQTLFVPPVPLISSSLK
jgi:hypothetical protein